MVRFYDEIPESLFGWIQKQHMFWVASAPLSTQGHVNVSPKGTAECFHIVNSKQVWYEDLTGSGVETISHIRENGRITVMFSAFEGPPRILRLFGIAIMLSVVGGTVHEYGTPEYNALIPVETRKPGSRAAIIIDIYQISTSCGYAVPLYDFVTHRTQLLRALDKFETEDRSLAASSARTQSEVENPLVSPCDANDLNAKSTIQPRTSLRSYWLSKNIHSLDGLPGLTTAPDAILSMTPQSWFDKDARPLMRHRKGPVKDLQGWGTGDYWGFASGFMCGTVAVLVIATALGKLRL